MIKKRKFIFIQDAGQAVHKVTRLFKKTFVRDDSFTHESLSIR